MATRTETRQPVSDAAGLRVAIVVGGRFVGFDIARALQRRDALAGIVSAYPRALREGIGRGLLRWNPVLGFREALSRRMHRHSVEEVNYKYATMFARWAADHLPDADVVQAWTGYALEPMASARRRGATTIAFRASAHIRTQVELLREEFARFGLSAPRAHDVIIERECEEYDSADMVNVISTFARRTFIERGFAASRLIMTPLAVEISEVSAGARRTPRNGPLRVLFLGNVSLQKGVHYLLEAAHGLGPKSVAVSLVGGVSADGEVILQRLAKPGEWKGKASRVRLAEIFSQHDVLVLPSVQDGFGAVLCEAMAAGLPVIATDHTGAPDVVRDGVDGLIVPAKSASALRDALELLVADPLRSLAMGEAAAAAMAQRRTWDHFVTDMVAQYAQARLTQLQFRGNDNRA